MATQNGLMILRGLIYSLLRATPSMILRLWRSASRGLVLRSSKYSSNRNPAALRRVLCAGCGDTVNLDAVPIFDVDLPGVESGPQQQTPKRKRGRPYAPDAKRLGRSCLNIRPFRTTGRPSRTHYHHHAVCGMVDAAHQRSRETMPVRVRSRAANLSGGSHGRRQRSRPERPD
jgi:hypothetical protein